MRSIILAIGLGSLCVAQSVDQLRQSFDQRCEQAATARDEQLDKLTKSYQTALERLLERTKTAGNLDAALPIHQEIEALKQEVINLPPLAETATELKPLRTKYLDSRHQILKTHATTLGGLADKMEAALKAREAELTKAGKIADALAARETREELAQDTDVRAARDLLKMGGAGGKPRAALQLRRYGDNLEVIVFYDRLGKISMDSPVENVREKTGDGKELGDTKAKVLGEFVGAKGYTVDPYVAYQHTFNTKNPGIMRSNEIQCDYLFEFEKAKGVRLTFKKGASNPYCIFPGILPPAANTGSYRVTAAYFIPKPNRIISGIQFIHGEGGGPPVGGLVLEEQGKWTTASVTGMSSYKSPNLVLYLCTPVGAKLADAVADYVALGNLKVEHIKFSAFVQQRFGESGHPEQVQSDALLQPVFVTNGEFAGKR